MNFNLFEQYETLPKEVQDVINHFGELHDEIDGYQNCANLVKALEEVGYTCDYYLTAEPYFLRKLLKKGGKYSYEDIEVWVEWGNQGLNETDYEIEIHGDGCIGSQFLSLRHKEDDELYSFVLEGATSNKYIYECIYSSKDVETLP